MIRLIVAALSILIGFVGLILPLLPGWVFFGVAALLLFPNSSLARKVLTRIELRFPSSGALLRMLLRDR